jgi:AcrR family transcriptional regulator
MPGPEIEPLTPERRRAMTRSHLLEAAASVFAQQGFHGASLDDVAARAGFTKGAVYSNFKSKDDLFLALLDDRMEREAIEVREWLMETSDDPEAQLHRIHEIIERTWDEGWNALYVEFVIYARRNPQAQAKLSELMRYQHELARHMFAMSYARAGAEPAFPLDLVTLVSTALFEGLGLARLVDPASVTPETIQEVLRFLFQTVGIDSADEG